MKWVLALGGVFVMLWVAAHLRDPSLEREWETDARWRRRYE